jgi:hypothetical protein
MIAGSNRFKPAMLERVAPVQSRSHILPRRLQRSRRSVTVVLAVGVFALACVSASAEGPRCVKGQSARGCAAGILTGLLGPSRCQTAAAPVQNAPAQTAADRLQGLIDYLPCPDSGRVSFDTRDNFGDSMSVLDPQPSPTGGYLGVYHTEFTPPGRRWAADFRISLARSDDLIHWTRVAVLDPTGASMPTLSAIPGTSGYLLAYEKRPRVGGGDVVRIRYYPSLFWLLGGQWAAQRDLPLTLSRYNDGTPTIVWVHWNGGLSRSTIGLGFHYETAPAGRRGPDREAIGTLRGFRAWTARTDPATDGALDRQGLLGSHGDWRQFSFAGGSWRLYEAQTAFDDFGAWRVILESQASGRMYPVTLTLGGEPVSNSFANPVAHVEPAPAGRGQVLVVTMFLFTAHAPAGRGELVYFQPI